MVFGFNIPAPSLPPAVTGGIPAIDTAAISPLPHIDTIIQAHASAGNAIIAKNKRFGENVKIQNDKELQQRVRDEMAESDVQSAEPTPSLQLLEQSPFPQDIVSADFYRYGVSAAGGVTKSTMSRQITPFYNQPAAIKVVQRARKGADTDLMPIYTKFILQSVQESHFERYQVVETFNDFYVFMFGERPPIYNFSGTLINTRNINWVQDFMLLYETFFRGTRCVEANAEIRLTYGGRSIAGYMLNVSSQTNAAVEEGVQFSFQLLVTKRTYLGLSVDFATQISAGSAAGGSAMDKKALEILAGPSGTGTSNKQVSTATNATKKAMGGGPSNTVEVFTDPLANDATLPLLPETVPES